MQSGKGSVPTSLVPSEGRIKPFVMLTKGSDRRLSLTGSYGVTFFG